MSKNADNDGYTPCGYGVWSSDCYTLHIFGIFDADDVAHHRKSITINLKGKAEMTVVRKDRIVTYSEGYVKST